MAESFAFMYHDFILATVPVWPRLFETTYVPIPACKSEHDFNPEKG